MRRAMMILTFLLVAIMGLNLVACNRDTSDGPPNVILDDSVCAECGMILSDERFVTASILKSDDELKPVVFDDFNCQLNFEQKHLDLVIIKRWSHSYTDSTWVDTAAGWFVQSPQIRSPMASNFAFFEHQSDAAEFATLKEGEVMSFDAVWQTAG